MAGLPESVDALIFDLGGVLIDIDFDRVFRHWACFTTLSASQIKNQFSMDAAYCAHERGRLSGTEYFEGIRRQFELDASEAQIIDGWNAIFVGPLTENLAAIEQLAESRPKFIFSNTNPTHEAHFRSRYEAVIQAFDGAFVSSTLGFRKPDRDAFAAVTGLTCYNASQLLFFDDTLLNVTAARALGIRSVLVNGPDSVRNGLTNLRQTGSESTGLAVNSSAKMLTEDTTDA